MSIFIQIINGFQKVHKSVIIEKFICNTFKVFLCIGLVNIGFGFFGFLAAELFASTLAFVLLSNDGSTGLRINEIGKETVKAWKTIYANWDPNLDGRKKSELK